MWYYRRGGSKRAGASAGGWRELQNHRVLGGLDFAHESVRENIPQRYRKKQKRKKREEKIRE